MESGLPERRRLGSGGEACLRARCVAKGPASVIPTVAEGLSKRLPNSGNHHWEHDSMAVCSSANAMPIRTYGLPLYCVRLGQNAPKSMVAK